MAVPARDNLFDLSRDIWSVSRLASEVRAVLDGSFPLLWVQGELSNLSQPASGHLYFTLKDEAAQVRCALFRPKRRLLAFQPGDGMQVLVRARVGLYEPRGEFQLIVEHMEPAGEGALRLELERRKRRLAAEGLFDEATKRPLPAFPRQIGLITSASGAALHDLLTVLGRRFALLPVLIYPAQVQGEGAAATLVDALALANRRGDCDLLILARGGGALEDLMAFNDEGLARAIRASRIPVVSGVGHEVDITIADLAADRRGATPSAAAELATPDSGVLAARIDALAGRIAAAMGRRRAGLVERLDAVARHLRLLHPAARLEQWAQSLDYLERRLAVAVGAGIGRQRARLDRLGGRMLLHSPRGRVALLARRLDALRARLLRAAPALLSERRGRLGRLGAGLDALSPLATLGRGYALVTKGPGGAVVTDAASAPAGTRLRVRLRRGELDARVEGARLGPGPPAAGSGQGDQD